MTEENYTKLTNDDPILYKDKHLDPWISMWSRPKATIQQIIEKDPKKHIYFLACIAGIHEALFIASDKNYGDHLNLFVLLIGIVISGGLMGLIGIHVLGAALKYTGKWLKGKANHTELKAAVAWGSVPMLYITIIWITELLFFGNEVFSTEMPTVKDSAFLAFSLGITKIIAYIYAFKTMVSSIGQVQGFSAQKAYTNLFLSGVIIVFPYYFAESIRALIVSIFQ